MNEDEPPRPPVSLEEMTRDERSLLIYLETCAVDYGGLVSIEHMNEGDLTIMEEWTESGFLEFGRITRASIKGLRDRSRWVKLSPTAWKLAHEERRARHKRIYDNRRWETTAEKRERGRSPAEPPSQEAGELEPQQHS